MLWRRTIVTLANPSVKGAARTRARVAGPGEAWLTLSSLVLADSYGAWECGLLGEVGLQPFGDYIGMQAFIDGAHVFLSARNARERKEFLRAFEAAEAFQRDRVEIGIEYLRQQEARPAHRRKHRR